MNRPAGLHHRQRDHAGRALVFEPRFATLVCSWLMKIAYLALALALLAVTACNNNDSSGTTTPGAIPTETIQFSGSLSVNSSNTLQVAIAQAGTISVTLTSLTTANGASTTSPPLAATVGLGIGTLAADGASCTLTQSVNVAPALTAQLSASLPTGTTCVQIFDLGNLSVPVFFTIRIVHT